MTKENTESAVRTANEKNRLWKRFCASGSIADYLAYSAFRSDKQANGNDRLV